MCDTVRLGNHSGSQGNPRFHYSEQYCPPVDPVLSQLKPLHSAILFGLIHDADNVI